MGPLGAILAMVAVTIGERIVLTIKIARDLGLHAEDWQGVREASWIALAAALAGVATAIGQALLVKGAPLLILACCALIFTTVYLVAIASFSIFRDEDIGQIRSLLGRVRA